jgi:hypothetical protein
MTFGVEVLHLVVDEGEVVDQLNGDGAGHRGLRGAAETGRVEAEGRADPLAPRVGRLAGRVFPAHDITRSGNDWLRAIANRGPERTFELAKVSGERTR